MTAGPKQAEATASADDAATSSAGNTAPSQNDADAAAAHVPSSDNPAPDAAAAAKSSGADAYHISLPSFEGPLDLLLHLIQKHELDILDIPIGFITEKYLGYLDMMQGLNIDVASEYLVMAATLAHLKSRLLLPVSPEDPEDGLEDADSDPRAELVRRLLEYQKYKLAAEQLGERHVLGRDVFVRGTSIDVNLEPAPLAPVNLFQLLDAFQSVLSRSKQLRDHEIDFERISITERISQLSDKLRMRNKLRFEELFDGQISRIDLITTFLALLEMVRLRLTVVSQPGPFDPIFIELAVRDDDDNGDEPDQPEGSADSESAPEADEASVEPAVDSDD